MTLARPADVYTIGAGSLSNKTCMPATELLSSWPLESKCAVASLESPRLSPNNVTISLGDTAHVAKLAALTTARLLTRSPTAAAPTVVSGARDGSARDTTGNCCTILHDRQTPHTGRPN